MDGAGKFGGGSWNVAGDLLTLTLSASSTLPTVDAGDTVTVTGTTVEDLAGNIASGAKTITGSFTVDTGGEDDEPVLKTHCGNGLKNGRLYKVGDDETVYLAAACRLKPFRGAAVFHARGHKFQNIIMLDSLDDITVSDKPVLPAGGTLVQGDDPTVWFITDNNRRRGFRTAAKFFALGFHFGQVKRISDLDLSLIPEDQPIEESESHPSGALVKCGNSAIVFQVIGNSKFPFESADAFQSRGHSFDHIANVDCGRFAYLNGAPITD